ncbi:MAG: protoporphyrinogen oxidase [Myxococcales bacterium]|nr:protoporphyrinogen oxidase [Myxococcales bacterium]
MTASLPTLDVAIIGGGVAGLATAHYLLARSPGTRLAVIEGSGRVGGNVRTLRHDDCLVDVGPDTLVTQDGASSACDDLGVVAESPSSAAARVHVAHDGRIDPMPEGLVFGVPRSFAAIARTRLLSLPAKLRAACDLVLPNREGDGSLSVVESRLGREAKENLVEPLVSGIYGGELERLDAGVVMPQLAGTRGSLIRALARAPRRIPKMVGPARGMETLVEALACSVSAERIFRARRVVAIERGRSGERLRFGDGSALDATQVVLATPPHAALPLLRPHVPELEGTLKARMRSAIVVVLAYDASTTKLPDGSGILVARKEAHAFVGVTFVHAKWPTRVREGRAVIRAVIDLDRRPDLAQASDDEIVRAVHADLSRHARVDVPLWAHVEHYPEATPIPELGHRARMNEARAQARNAGFSLVGAAYDGAGLAGCLRGARELAEALAGG